MAESLRFGQISFAAPDSFFRTLAFGNIHYSADQFDKLSVFSDTVSDRAHEFHRAVRHYQPVLKINLISFLCLGKGRIPHLKIVRMNTVANQFVCWFNREVKTADAISFL